MQLTNFENEIWKDLEYPYSQFQISNLGRIKGKSRYIEYMQSGKVRKRFQKERIYNFGNSNIARIPINNTQDIKFYIDELVIKYFTDFLYDNWKIIVHKDSCITNNNVENLEVVDPFSDKSENWKYIPNWKPYYLASDKGRILRCPFIREGAKLVRCSLLKTKSKSNNLQYVRLIDPLSGHSESESVHRIVAKTFINNVDNKNVIHKNRNKNDNRVENLELVDIDSGYVVDTSNCDDEIWRDIPNYENKYQVSNYGNVRSLNRNIECTQNNKEYTRIYKGKMLIQGDVDGYKTVYLDKTYMVHRLVASAFIPNPDNKPEVNHKDRNHANNHISNLEWVTKAENTKHALENGWDPGAGRRGKTNSKYWYECIKKVNHTCTPELVNKLRHSHKKQSKRCRCLELNKEFDSIAEAARYMNYDSSTLSYMIKNNKKIKNNQYTFIFI